MKSKLESNGSILHDFFKYALYLFVPFCILGVIYTIINGFSLVALVLNPLSYSIGISLIIIVIKYDINELLELVGMGKEPKLSMHIKYSKEVLEIGTLMSLANYEPALKKVDALVKKEPRFAIAHNLRGEILLRGYQRKKEARESFNKVIQLTDTDTEEYKLAKTLKTATYNSS